MDGTLSLQQAPPLSVPVRFFLTAPVFGVIAALVMLLNADLLVSRWTPGMLAITHCLVLGFFTTVMIGAVQQLLPVVAGAVIARPRLIANLIWCQWVPGILLLVYAFMWPAANLFLVGTVLVAGAVLTFITVVVWALYKSESINESVAGISLALGALLITLLLGAVLATGYMEFIPLWRIPLTDLHLSWGLIGWIGVLVMAIAWQVVPLFQITPPYPAWLRRSTVPMILFLLVAKSALAWAGQGPGLSYVGAVLDMIIAGYLACFAIATLLLQRKARRKIKDSHRNYWRLAVVNLVVTVMVWVVAEVTGNPVYDLLAAVIFLLGFVMAVVIGMLLKIISFLVWLHLQTQNDSLKMKGESGFKIPKMKTVIAPRTSDRLLLLLVAAQLTVVAALFLPEYISEVAAILWLAVFGALGVVLGRTVYRYRVLHREMTANT